MPVHLVAQDAVADPRVLERCHPSREPDLRVDPQVAALELFPDERQAWDRVALLVVLNGRAPVFAWHLARGRDEQAIVDVRIDREVHPFTRIPTIAPRIGERELFVSHPEVSAWLRRENAAFLFEVDPWLAAHAERREEFLQRLEELGTALNERKTERLQKEALWRQMASARNPEELPEVMRSPLVQSLRIELASLERQEAQLLERYLDQHPEVVKVRKQITDTRVKIRAEAQHVIRAAENDYKAAAAQERSVEDALEAAWLEDPPASERAFATGDVLLERGLEATRELSAVDRRPPWARRYWRHRDRRCGLLGRGGDV